MNEMLLNLIFPFSDGRWDPEVLIEGVLFRARYLGSTQLVCEGQPTKTTRMMQAEEAVSRIKVRRPLYLIFVLYYSRYPRKVEMRSTR